jgi:hypothetical protein
MGATVSYFKATAKSLCERPAMTASHALEHDPPESGRDQDQLLSKLATLAKQSWHLG